MNKTLSRLWNHEEPIVSYPGWTAERVPIPEWIDPKISPSNVAAILEGGCDSGAYLPAVTYHAALETLNTHGEAIFDYLEDSLGELPPKTSSVGSWAGLAVFYLSYAVELWALEVKTPLNDLLPHPWILVEDD